MKPLELLLNPPVGGEWRACRGVAIGGCVAGRAFGLRVVAHAHNVGGAHAGWICAQELWRVGHVVLRRVGGRDGSVTRPSRVLLHELAHVLTPHHAHDATWRAMMLRLGQSPSVYLEDLALAEVAAQHATVAALIARDSRDARRKIGGHLSIAEAISRQIDVERIITRDRRTS